MSKKIRIKLKDLEKLEFEICENANAGDYISLNEINEIDFSSFVNKLNDKKNIFFNSKLEEEKKNWENDFLLHNKDVNKLRDDNKVLNQKLNNLENHLNHINDLNNSEIEKIKLKTENEYKDKINDLENKLNKIKEQNNFEKENIRLKIENEYKDKINEFNEKINILKSENNEIKFKHHNQIETLKREKNLNIKILGEELEKWIHTEYSNSFGILPDCKFEKTTKAIDNTKPDFLFQVIDTIDNSVLSSVTIEAKTQYIENNSPKKNSDFYNKLESDRKKNNSEFSLLITELEPDDAFIIKKVNDPNYENMFVVRPTYFITFLSIVRLFSLKRKDLKKIEINFKNKKDILDEFEKMKDEILDNSIKHINTNVQTILDSSKVIKANIEKIEKSANTVIESHLKTIKNKIESFKINKKIEKIEKLNE